MRLFQRNSAFFPVNGNGAFGAEIKPGNDKRLDLSTAAVRRAVVVNIFNDEKIGKESQSDWANFEVSSKGEREKKSAIETQNRFVTVIGFNSEIRLPKSYFLDRETGVQNEKDIDPAYGRSSNDMFYVRLC